MDPQPVADGIVADLDLIVSGPAPTGSASESQVLAVITGDGTDAILKITLRQDRWTWDASLRELNFYQETSASLGVRTPRLLDHRLTDDTIALVITRHTAPLAAREWDHDLWLLLADDLATIHRRHLDAVSAPSSFPSASDAATEFWKGSSATLAGLLREPDDLLQRRAALGTCYVHGDCHADNISVSDEGLIWLDWQAAGPGNPAGDLAFPSVRGRPSGAEVPLSAMAERYADRRGLQPGAVLDAMLSAELSVLLFQWPDYAQFNSAEGNARVRVRADHLSKFLTGTQR